MVISARVDLHFELRAAGGRSIKEFFGWRWGIPDIL
jgi:hypothetical protein